MADQGNTDTGTPGDVGTQQDYADPVSTYNPFGTSNPYMQPQQFASANTTSLLGGGTPTRDPSSGYNAPPTLSGPQQPVNGGGTGVPNYTPPGNYGSVNTNPVTLPTSTQSIFTNYPTPGSVPGSAAPTQGIVPQGNTGPTAPTLPWGTAATNPAGWAQYAIQQTQSLQQQAAPKATAPPPESATWTPTQWNDFYKTQPGGVNAAPPGSAPPVNPFAGSNPFYPSPSGTGPGGQFNLNPTYFPTANTAAIVSGMAPGSSVITNPNGFLGAAGSPFTQNQPSQQVRLADGTIINPGNIANDYATYNDPSQARLLQSLVQSELGGAPLAGTYAAYNPALANTNPANQLPSGPATSNPSGAGVQYPNVNSFTGQPLVQGAQSILQGTPSTILGGGTPATAGGGTPGTGQQQPGAGAPGPTPGDLQSLQNALLFLQAYSGLGSGGGNPTSVNPKGQLDPALMALLSGLLGQSGGLYSRQRQYPQFP